MKKLQYIIGIVIVSFLIYGFINNRSSQNKEMNYGTIQDSDGDDVTIGTAIGNKAPELKYNNPDGQEITLSSLKGQMVLIDFWASWCGPCRRENPNVVAAYKKYKDKKFKNGKGFTVYSVSLDKNLNAWKAAIVKDGLVWDYHVSDLKFWKSEAAAKYGVVSIPSSFLINGDGIIVGKNLRGTALESKLEDLLK